MGTQLAVTSTKGLVRLRFKAGRLAIFSLAGFGVGMTQSGAASVVNDQGADLGVTVDALGYTMVAYALGVVIGSPLVMLGLGKWNRRHVLLLASGLFVATTVWTCFAGSWAELMVARFFSGFPHGALLGTAIIVGTEMLGRHRRGRVIATVMAGLTSSSILGVPAMQLISEKFSWQSAYVVVGIIGLLAFVGILLFIPSVSGNPTSSFHGELKLLGRSTVIAAILTITIGFTGFAAVFSYIVPLLQVENGYAPQTVTWVLMSWGLSQTISAIIGGRVTDWSVAAALRWGMIATAGALLLLGLVGNNRVLVIPAVLLVGFVVQIFSQGVQAHLMDQVGDSPSLGAAAGHAVLNLANAVGSGIGALVIGLGFGFVAPAWAAFALTAVAIVLVYRAPGFYRGPILVRKVLAPNDGEHLVGATSGSGEG